MCGPILQDDGGLKAPEPNSPLPSSLCSYLHVCKVGCLHDCSHLVMLCTCVTQCARRRAFTDVSGNGGSKCPFRIRPMTMIWHVMLSQGAFFARFYTSAQCKRNKAPCFNSNHYYCQAPAEWFLLWEAYRKTRGSSRSQWSSGSEHGKQCSGKVLWINEVQVQEEEERAGLIRYY